MLDHFGLLAPFYDRIFPPPDPTQLRQLPDLPAPGLMLDVGGGTGRIAALLQPLVGRLIISDPSAKMMRQAQNKGHLTSGRLLPVQGHAERLPFPDAAFARVLVVDALHHFHNQRQAVHELARVLQPGGRLVIEEPDINRLSGKGAIYRIHKPEHLKHKLESDLPARHPQSCHMSRFALLNLQRQHGYPGQREQVHP